MVDVNALEVFPTEGPSSHPPAYTGSLLSIEPAGPPVAQPPPNVVWHSRHHRQRRQFAAALKGLVDRAGDAVVVVRSAFTGLHIRSEPLLVIAIYALIVFTAGDAVRTPKQPGATEAASVVAAPGLLATVARMSLVDLRPAVREVRTPPRIESRRERQAELQRIQRTLHKYRDAFSILDARVAKSVWPTADATALAARFERITHQNYEFDTCRISVGNENAEATCRGLVEYQPAGSRVPRRHTRSWLFSLRKVQDNWVIESVDAP